MRFRMGLPVDNADLIDRILQFCPTFSTLQSAILVSKDFYNVYSTHPRSITRAVAYNTVGAALPSALRVIRYPHYPTFEEPTSEDEDEDEERGDDFVELALKIIRKQAAMDPYEMANACPEEHSPSVLTTQEKNELIKYAETVKKLEDIYSLTTKDRTSKTSTLTTDESFIFRRAVYRIIHFCKLFPSERDDDETLQHIDQADLPMDLIKKVQQQRTAVLNVYDSEELREICSVLKFMKEVYGTVEGGDALVNSHLDILLSCGPEIVVDVWNERSLQSAELHAGFLLDSWGDQHPLYAGYFSRSLEDIWLRRNVKPPKDDEPASKYILDEVFGANDTCSQCPTPGGLKLLNKANWGRLPAFPVQLLRGKLQYTRTVTQLYNQATAPYYGTDALGEWIEDIFTHNLAGPAPAGSSLAGIVSNNAPAPVTPLFLPGDDGEDEENGDDSVGASGGGAVPAALVHAPPQAQPRMINQYTRDWSGWDVDMSYCEPCLRAFLLDHTWRWWHAEWQKRGWTPPSDDCWYGYNCNTQTHNHVHAAKLNHLCPPTRGNP
ncbi:hypothetical protein MKEN_01003600 [Mycena kentingensis (nom. inval.)]|nr:hypothetical protein MKEN_01003600 [Mycena kentingensis (nom. inval.)]